MATSSKVVFNLKHLQEKAQESIDSQINQKQLEVNSFEDEAALEERIREWRIQQEERVSELSRQLGENEVDNYQLSQFKLDPIPTIDRYDQSRAERDLRTLEAKRSRILAKSTSLVGDESGNISLTKTQLEEFFAL